MAQQNTIGVNIPVNQEIDDWLENKKKRTGNSKARIVRELIMAEMAKEKKNAKP